MTHEQPLRTYLEAVRRSSWMREVTAVQVLGTVIGAAAASLGAIIGGYITFRAQIQIQKRGHEVEILRDKQQACIEFLTATRAFRRFVMYTTGEFQVVEATESSKGVVILEGRGEYDQRLDEALSRLMIVVHSEPVIKAAIGRASDLNEFIRERATLGRGRVPSSLVHEMRRKERNFASLAIAEISGIRLPISDWAAGDA